jgi:hypothetical protein
VKFEKVNNARRSSTVRMFPAQDLTPPAQPRNSCRHVLVTNQTEADACRGMLFCQATLQRKVLTATPQKHREVTSRRRSQGSIRVEPHTSLYCFTYFGDSIVGRAEGSSLLMLNLFLPRIGCIAALSFVQDTCARFFLPAGRMHKVC